MTAPKPPNPPVFPIPGGMTWRDWFAFPAPNTAARDGMTLRDWFAGMALGAVFEAADTGTQMRHICDRAYFLADDMLAAREATK